MSTETTERAPFDPTDPMDIMSDMFRKQICDLALNADKVTLYREMDENQKLQCFVAGAMTGIVGVCLAFVQPQARDDLMKALQDALIDCREMAEGIMDDNTHSS